MVHKILAPMAGTMWKVLVGVGDQVAAGDTVAILESMMMEIPIEAEASGRVATIDGPEGTVLDEDAVVMTLES
jgi:acetyl-CoA carboxylase biotin carboxyl carrier protein